MTRTWNEIYDMKVLTLQPLSECHIMYIFKSVTHTFCLFRTQFHLHELFSKTGKISVAVNSSVSGKLKHICA